MEVIEKEKPPSGDRVKDKLINFRIIFEKEDEHKRALEENDV
jgi:hypothetical protein